MYACLVWTYLGVFVDLLKSVTTPHTIIPQLSMTEFTRSYLVSTSTSVCPCLCVCSKSAEEGIHV